jgi:predicted transport protein
MVDHHGDFEIAVQKAFPNEKIDIDWSDIIVICITPNFKKYDLKAVQRIGENIELWKYRYYEDGSLYFDLIYRNPVSKQSLSENKEIASTSEKETQVEEVKEEYFVSNFISKLSTTKLNLFHEIQDFINGLDDTVEEVPKKFYIAYKTTQNVVCLETHKNKVVIYLKLDPSSIPDLPSIARDVTKIGHFGTGNLEITISKDGDVEIAKKYITKTFENLGGN